MKKILIFDTSIASLNIGDEIIMDSFWKNMEELLDDSYLMIHPTHTPTYNSLQNLLFERKLKEFKNADLKFVGGSNLLYTNMLRPLPSWNINIFNKKLLNGSILTGVGCGVNSKKMNFYTRFLYKSILSKDFVHSVRDEKTLNIITSLGFKAVNTGCMTLWGFTNEFCESIPKKKSKNVVFTLTNYLPDVVNDKQMINILLNEYESVFFWPQCIEDYNYLSTLTNIDSIKIINPNLKSYKDFLINNETDYIGNRLHGGIFAMQHKRRSIIIEIDYRVKEKKQTYNLNSIERKKINQLTEIINSEFETRIKIDLEKIKLWKSQFKFIKDNEQV